METGINIEDIGKMEEILMSFNMSGTFTVYLNRAEDTRITITRSEKCNFTIILCLTVDSGKLTTLVIFIKKTIPKEKFPKSLLLKLTKKIGARNYANLVQ